MGNHAITIASSNFKNTKINTQIGTANILGKRVATITRLHAYHGQMQTSLPKL